MEKNYRELLSAYDKGEVDKLTDEEKSRLYRVREQPEIVRDLVHERVTKLSMEILDLAETVKLREKERDELSDWLNGHIKENENAS